MPRLFNNRIKEALPAFHRRSFQIAISAVLLFFIIIALPGLEHHSQWDSKCGLLRHITVLAIGPFRVVIHTRTDETVLYTYYLKTFGPCTEAQWHSYHGQVRKLLFYTYTYSAPKPIDLRFAEQDLEFLYNNDRSLLRNLLSYILTLPSRDATQQRDLWLNLQEISGERDVQRWRAWWAAATDQAR